MPSFPHSYPSQLAAKSPSWSALAVQSTSITDKFLQSPHHSLRAIYVDPPYRRSSYQQPLLRHLLLLVFRNRAFRGWWKYTFVTIFQSMPDEPGDATIVRRLVSTLRCNSCCSKYARGELSLGVQFFICKYQRLMRECSASQMDISIRIDNTLK